VCIRIVSVVKSRWLSYFVESRSICQKFYFLESKSSFLTAVSKAQHGILWEYMSQSCNKLMREANSDTYMELLDKLNLWNLEERRNRSDLIEVCKMAKNLSPISLTKFFELNTDNRTRGHSFKLIKHRCNCADRHHFFSERVVNRWNMLNQDTVSAKSVNGFKSKLESERKRKMGSSGLKSAGPRGRFPSLEQPDLWVTAPVS